MKSNQSILDSYGFITFSEDDEVTLKSRDLVTLVRFAQKRMREKCLATADTFVAKYDIEQVPLEGDE